MIKLIKGECLHEINKIEDESVDLVVTDPPYSKNSITAHSRNGVRNLSDLSIQEHFYKNMYAEISRVLKTGGVCLTFCDDLFYPVLFASSYHSLQGHSLIVWDKQHISFGKPIRKRHELIMYNSKGGSGKFYSSNKRSHFPSVVQYQRLREKVHDAQKPCDLITDLVEHFSDKGSTILDCFMGSGTTGVACKRLGRNFIGIELEPEYVEIARQRIASAEAQPHLVA